MSTHRTSVDSSWSTSSFGCSADTSPAELAALRDHLGRCYQGRGWLFELQCTVDALHLFLSARLVTTLALAAVLTAAIAAGCTVL